MQSKGTIKKEINLANLKRNFVSEKVGILDLEMFFKKIKFKKVGFSVCSVI